MRRTFRPASGVGGGSADAAAALRGMLMRSARTCRPRIGCRRATRSLKPFAERDSGAWRGCARCAFCRNPCRARGIGEKLEFVALPKAAGACWSIRVCRCRRRRCLRGWIGGTMRRCPTSLPEFETVAGSLIDWLAVTAQRSGGPGSCGGPGDWRGLAGRASPICRGAGWRGCRDRARPVSRCSNPTPRRCNRRGGSCTTAHPGWWLAGGVVGRPVGSGDADRYQLIRATT